MSADRGSSVGVRARWHTPDLGVPDEDPFATPGVVGRIEEVGTPIDLDGPEAKLNERLVSLVRRENHLDERGVTCSVKDRADTSCHACPMSQYENTDSDLGMLCRLGREQEQVVTTIAVIGCSKSR